MSNKNDETPRAEAEPRLICALSIDIGDSRTVSLAPTNGSWQFNFKRLSDGTGRSTAISKEENGLHITAITLSGEAAAAVLRLLELARGGAFLEAQEAGCVCPVGVPNNPGQTLFYAPDCPLHGTPKEAEPET